MHRRAVILGLGVAVALTLATAASAGASWSGDSPGDARARATSLEPGNTPSVSVSGRDATVSWNPSSIAGGPAATSYVVKRYNGSGQQQTIGAGCSGSVTATSCTENAVPSGSWRYSVTPRFANWTGAESAQSSSATVGAPSLSVSPTTVTSLPNTLSGQIQNFVSGQSVTFRLDDPTSGQLLTGSITPSSVPANGSASVSVTLPSGISNGSHTIYAIGNQGDQASASVTVNVPSPNLVYGGTGNPVSRTNNGTLSVPYPAGTTSKDLLLLIEVNANNNNPTTPSGWTLLADQGSGNPGPFRFTVWWKLAGAESSTSLQVNTNGNGASAWVARYRRPAGYPPDPSTATATVRQGTSAAAATLTPSPNLTTNAANATVISIVGIRAANSLSMGAPNGFSQQLATTNSPSQGVGLAIADQLVAASGTTPASPTWAQVGTPGKWAWATVAFR